MLSVHERRELLLLARASLRRELLAEPSELPEPSAGLQRPAGAFVTLRRRDGSLRGCIGRTDVSLPLWEAVARMAVAAGTRDPRFAPVQVDELPSLGLEVSVLGPLSPAAPQELILGRHGAVVEQGERRGLLLPQVAVEQGWSRQEFLAATCRKAGLPPDALQRGAELFVFEAAHFSDDSLS